MHCNHIHTHTRYILYVHTYFQLPNEFMLIVNSRRQKLQLWERHCFQNSSLNGCVTTRVIKTTIVSPYALANDTSTAHTQKAFKCIHHEQSRNSNCCFLLSSGVTVSSEYRIAENDGVELKWWLVSALPKLNPLNTFQCI